MKSLCILPFPTAPPAPFAQRAPPPAPYVLERATTETAVEVPHKSTGRKIAEALRNKGLSEDLTIIAISTLP
ncbi:MAG: hypothetical protein PHO14_05890, partial [Kiritimatiellae bacterium]|nr:hypothetical protein [Kiritimatiellia bacterium]